MRNQRRACGGGPKPSILQAAVALIDGLREDGLDMQVGRHVFGRSSTSDVDAVNALYRAIGIDTRPDLVDLHHARRDTALDHVSVERLQDAMRTLIARRTPEVPEIR